MGPKVECTGLAAILAEMTPSPPWLKANGEALQGKLSRLCRCWKRLSCPVRQGCSCIVCPLWFPQRLRGRRVFARVLGAMCCEPRLWVRGPLALHIRVLPLRLLKQMSARANVGPHTYTSLTSAGGKMQCFQSPFPLRVNRYRLRSIAHGTIPIGSQCVCRKNSCTA